MDIEIIDKTGSEIIVVPAISQLGQALSQEQLHFLNIRYPALPSLPGCIRLSFRNDITPKTIENLVHQTLALTCLRNNIIQLCNISPIDFLSKDNLIFSCVNVC